MTLAYLSPVDCNWPGGYPADAIFPDGGPPESADAGADRLAGADTSADGTIVFQTQTLVERAPVAGTPFELSYRSDRQLDRTARNTLRIPLSKPSTTLPASLQRIDVRVRVAGHQFLYCFDANTADATCADIPADRLFVFSDWDGSDVYGRMIQGAALAEVNVEYVYERVYTEVGAQSQAAFGQTFSATPIAGAQPRGEIVAGRRWKGTVGGWDALGLGLGGWSLDVHHAYDPLSGTLNGGDGSSETNAAIGPVVRTVAGDGTLGFGGDGGSATATGAWLRRPRGVAV